MLRRGVRGIRDDVHMRRVEGSGTRLVGSNLGSESTVIGDIVYMPLNPTGVRKSVAALHPAVAVPVLLPVLPASLVPDVVTELVRVCYVVERLVLKLKKEMIKLNASKIL